MKKSFLLASLLLVNCVYGQIPAGNYNIQCSRINFGLELKSLGALYNIIKDHNSVTYEGLRRAMLQLTIIRQIIRSRDMLFHESRWYG